MSATGVRKKAYGAIFGFLFVYYKIKDHYHHHSKTPRLKDDKNLCERTIKETYRNKSHSHS